MCGINGIYAYAADAPVIERAELLRTRDAMRARGPDGAGSWYSADGRTALGHRRLAIIDLSELAAQPMSTSDGRYTVTFNGEIYNYPELRQELIQLGVNFRSHSDTEVLLHLYRREGVDMLRRLRGMFAFAIWDAEKQELFLARDPYGIKPLYYSDDGRTFRFASQVKALLAGGALSDQLDPAGVVGFFLWGSVPEPHTLYEGVRILPAGTYMSVRAGIRNEPKTHWTLPDAIARATAAAEAIPAGSEKEYVRTALVDSIRAHMVSDVPVGAFLSAGLDSSTLVGLARELTGKPLHTVTLTFADFVGRPTDELPLAREIARHLDVHHSAVTLDMAEVEADLAVFFAAMDQPTIDGINTWFVSKATVQAGLKVALSGLGGDELLGGYPSFRSLPEMVAKYRKFDQLPLLGKSYRHLHSLLSPYLSNLDPGRAGLYEFGGNFAGAYHLHRGVFMPWELSQVLDQDFALEGMRRLHDAATQEPAAPLNGFGQVVNLESSRYMRNQLLRDSDWVSMAHSLEVRVPLVDRELTERIVGLAVLGRLGTGKSILPKMLSRSLPQAVLEKPKTGFTVPIWKWLRKSPELDAWKRIKPLQRKNAHDHQRLAYSIMARIPEARGVLR